MSSAYKDDEFKSPSTTITKHLNAITLKIVQTAPFILNNLPFFFGVVSFSLLRFCFLELYFHSRWHPVYLFMLLISLSEVIFFAYCLNSNRILNNSSPPPRPNLSKTERASIVKMLNKSMLDSEHIAKGWLAMDTERMKSSDLNRNHILDWIGWTVFGKSSIELEAEELEEAENYLIEANLGNFLKISPSKNQQAIRMFNQLPVPFQHIPLFGYIIVYIIKSLSCTILKLLGFIYSSVDGISNISYWVRFSKCSEASPIIFCHGVGIGPAMYMLFIYKLAKLYPNRTIIVLQIEYLSMNLVEKPLSREEHLKFFENMFEKHSLDQAHWISHSFGSFLISGVASKKPHLIKKLTFIDPVCFNLSDPYLVYQVYHGPLKSISFQYIVRYLVGYEFSVVRFFLRNFWWEEMMFFPDYMEKIEGEVKVYLSENDVLVNCETIENCFKANFKNYSNFTYSTLKSAQHGGCIWNLKLMENILNSLN